MEEQTIAMMILYLIGQTIALWQKLSKIEQKIDNVTDKVKNNEKEIKKIKTDLTKYVYDKFPQVKI